MTREIGILLCTLLKQMRPREDCCSHGHWLQAGNLFLVEVGSRSGSAHGCCVSWGQMVCLSEHLHSCSVKWASVYLLTGAGWGLGGLSCHRSAVFKALLRCSARRPFWLMTSLHSTLQWSLPFSRPLSPDSLKAVSLSTFCLFCSPFS